MISTIDHYKKRDVLSCVFVFVSLLVYLIRERGEGVGDIYNYFIIIEVVLLVTSFIIARNDNKKYALLIILALVMHRIITLPLVWHDETDFVVAVNKTALVAKCILAYSVIVAMPRLFVLYGGLVTTALFLFVLYFRLYSGAYIDDDGSFAGGLSDRNYMGLSLAFLSYLIIITYNKIKDRLSNSQKNVYEILIVAVLLLSLVVVVRSGSRSSLISIFICAWLYRPWVSVLIASLIVPLLLNSEISDFLVNRLQRSNENIFEEYSRLAQIEAAWNLVEENPLAIILGYGLMASHHIGWFGGGYMSILYIDDVTVLHNSFVELLISFGVVAVFIIWKIFKRMSKRSWIFFLAAGSFINVLGFLPFYCALAIASETITIRKSVK